MQVLKGHIQESMGKGKDSSEETLNELSRRINEKIDAFRRKNRGSFIFEYSKNKTSSSSAGFSFG